MIIVSNVLVMNGGTTFLLRFCREWSRRGRKVAVLLLFREYDTGLLAEIKQYATVLRLSDYAGRGVTILPSRMHMFGPVRWRALLRDLRPFSGHVHVMGLFGLLFAERLKLRLSGPVSAGVYHQNEFLFEQSGSRLEAEAFRTFAALPAENIVFFNESTKANYRAFFGRDFTRSPILPIGIDLPTLTSRADTKPFHIISVGNLVRFKTYNEHMIRIVAQLAAERLPVRYDIYGAGPDEARLKGIAASLGVSDRVRLHEPLPYADFRKTVAAAALFVGSGTALLEAAALGVPALVGIESIAAPETYGFLSDVQGFSYNEDGHAPKVQMAPLVARVLTDPAYNEAVGSSCRAKAATFSISETVDGFISIAATAKPGTGGLSGVALMLLAVSTVKVSLLQVLGLDRRFASRRNQSFRSNCEAA